MTSKQTKTTGQIRKVLHQGKLGFLQVKPSKFVKMMKEPDPIPDFELMKRFVAVHTLKLL